MSLVHYIFVRKDLPLGTLAAMVTHAAGESGAMWGYQDGGGLPPHTTAVVLEANDEAHLGNIANYLGREGLLYEAVYESSEPYIGQLMAIGLWPDDRAYFGTLLAHFKLLKTCLPTIPLDNEITT
jgi:hypothetical protein